MASAEKLREEALRRGLLLGGFVGGLLGLGSGLAEGLTNSKGGLTNSEVSQAVVQGIIFAMLIGWSSTLIVAGAVDRVINALTPPPIAKNK